MGLLDPQVDKERTFELLRKRNVLSAELYFYGGHDEGSVESITLTFADGDTASLDVWYCGGYRYEDGQYVPLSVAANEDEELSDLLQGPINAQFGSWGDIGSTSGTLVWNVIEESCRMNYTQEQPIEEHLVF